MKFIKPFFIVSICFCIFSVLTPFISNKHSVVFADTINQVQQLTLENLGTYYLYPNNNGVSSICDFFEYKADGNYWEKRESELYHKYKSRMQITKETTKFISTINLSDALKNASKNGYLSVSASAYFASEYGGKILFVDDSVDELKMSLSSLTSSGEIVASNSVDYTSYNYSDTPFVLDINASGGEYIQLKFEELYGKTVYEIMRVKEPTITLSSTDITAPNVKLSKNVDGFTNNRTVTLNITDIESGIYSVKCNNATLKDYVISNDTKSATYTYEISDNGEYNFIVTDNVGNTITKSYTENQIDKQKPSLILINGLEDIYYTKVITFEATYQQNFDYSNEYYVYTIDGTLPNKNSQTLINGTNKIEVQNNGEHTLKILSFDDAGNYNELQEFNFYVDDNYYSINISSSKGGNVPQSIFNLRYGEKQTITFNTQNGYEFYYVTVNGEKIDINSNSIDLEVYENIDVHFAFRQIVNVVLLTSSYSFTGEVVNLNFSCNIEDKSLINFEFYKNNEHCEFIAEGEYEIRYSIDNEEYIGSGLLYANITQKNIGYVNLNKTEYVYDPNGLQLDFSSNVEKDLIIFTYYNLENTQIETPTNVGDYIVSYNISTENFIGSGILNFKIIKKQIPIYIEEPNFVYDGSIKSIIATNDFNIQMNITYYLNGEVVQPLNAGIYSFKVEIDDNNYTGTLNGEFTIQKASVDLSITNNSFIYDGQAKIPQIIIANQLPYSTFILQNDCVTTPINAGDYILKIIVDQENYFCEQSFNFTIQKRLITVSAQNKIITYGDNYGDFSYTIENNIKSDNLEFDLFVKDYSVNVGTYEIVFNQINLNNYLVQYNNAILTIEQKEIDVFIDNDNQKTYGEKDLPIRYSYDTTDVMYNDNLNFLITRQPGENVGSYEINDVTVDNQNYKINLVSFSYKINKRKVVIKIEDSIKTYGELDPQFDFNLYYGDIINDDILVYSYTRDLGENVGEYKISLLETNNNYEIICVDGKLVVEPKEISVVADEISIVYGQEEHILTYTTSLLNNDKLYGELVREQGNNVGEYNITIGSLHNENYLINFTGAKYTITKAPLYISANAVNKYYGDGDPVLTYSANGFVNDEVYEINLIRQIGEEIGSYEILLGNDELENYEINYTSNYLYIEKKPITLIFDNNQSKNYGETDPKIKFSLSIEQTPNDLIVYREEGENVGEYKLYVQSCELKNYVITSYNDCYFTINKANISISINDGTFTYDGKNHTLTINENYDVNYHYYQNGIEINNPTNAGEYTVVAVFEGNENYNNAKSNYATLIIQKKSVFITVEQDLFVYDGNAKLPVFTLSEECSAIVEMDTLNAIDIGIYDFEIVVNETNYFGSINGQLKIIEAPTFENENGNQIFDVNGDLITNSVSVTLCEDTSSKTLSNLNKLLNSKKALSSYSFDVTGNLDSNTTVVVKLKIQDTENFNIYLYNDKNEIKEVGYKIEDGKIVFEISDLSLKFMLAKENDGSSWLLYLAIGVGIVIIIIVAWLSIKMYIFVKKTLSKDKEEKQILKNKHHKRFRHKKINK